MRESIQRDQLQYKHNIDMECISGRRGRMCYPRKMGFEMSNELKYVICGLI